MLYSNASIRIFLMPCRTPNLYPNLPPFRKSSASLSRSAWGDSHWTTLCHRPPLARARTPYALRAEM
eukprot:5009124-Pyramimonas_sp.AAC.1